MAYRATEHTKAKKAGTRNRILKESRLLVAEGGFQTVAVAEVAKRSDIATGTIYRHFPSKGELVAEVFRHATEHELEAVTKASQQSGNCQDRLIYAIETFAERALQSPRLAYALIAEPVDQLVEKERLSYRLAYAEAFEDVVNEGISVGEFVVQNATVTAASLVGMLSEALVGPLAPQMVTYEEQVGQREALSEEEKLTLIREIKSLALRAVAGRV
ncbi:TetR/AcrR family transcriptional regulator [Oceaniserpentilla sp. 4NH20-0058]|uniref:TetR/AcrR family transcriptional regulator n=1 Tax=Oceaniserpentilla sp. 4NH20-0058 TaxID=3127660 RepID=UPI00310309F9